MIDLDKLEQLPLRENRAAYLTRKYKSVWNLKRFDGLDKKYIDAYVTAKRVIKKYLNKPVDDAYKAYCKRIFAPYRGEFHYCLNKSKHYSYFRRDSYWVDDEGIIRKTPYKRSKFIKMNRTQIRLSWEKRDALKKQNRCIKQVEQKVNEILFTRLLILEKKCRKIQCGP